MSSHLEDRCWSSLLTELGFKELMSSPDFERVKAHLYLAMKDDKHQTDTIQDLPSLGKSDHILIRFDCIIS